MAAEFETFLEGWLMRQQQYLDELLLTTHNTEDEHEHEDLINRVLSHYLQYYDAKLRVSQHNIFLVFSPHWFNSLECSLLWIAGFRPLLAFRLVSVAVQDLSAEQRQRINTLQDKTRLEMRILSDELARIHETIAAPPFYEVARRYHARRIDCERIGADEAMETMRTQLEVVVANADLLRITTAREVVGILNKRQCIKFLTSIAQFQIRLRSWGLHRDAEQQE
ncbi:hypothetical protein ACFE04_016089 [Oxalis oulophora]